MQVLAGVGIASGVLANALGVFIFLVTRTPTQGAPTTRDYALGCGMLVAYGIAFSLVLLGGICSIAGMVEAGRRRVSPVPSVVGLVLNAIPVFVASVLSFVSPEAPSGAQAASIIPRSPHASLKSFVSAQAEFRANDRNENGRPDFWRADIAGLYWGKDANKLIEVSLALADAEPKTPIPSDQTRGPRLGYWYKALRFADEKVPDPDRFAACGYPASPGQGRMMYLITQENVLWEKPLEGDVRPPDVVPSDLPKDGWRRKAD